MDNTTADTELLVPPESGSVYRAIRDDILSGHLAAGERLVVSTLAQRHGTSTNPVREALQQLRGEGFVVFSHNRGARVRPIEEEFVRDIYEMEALIEPYLAEAFVEMVTDTDLSRLVAIEEEIEALDFTDRERNAELDLAFHRTIYERHYNRHAVEMWWRHREILWAISRGLPLSVARRRAVVTDHRALIEAFRTHDTKGATEAMARHVRGSGAHTVEQMRARRRGAVI